MAHYPDYSTFSELARRHQRVPVYRRLVSDMHTPVTAFHKLDAGSCGCLCESVIGGEKVGRYSFLTAEPFLRFTAYGNRVSIVSDAGTEDFDSPDPLAELQRRVEAIRPATLPDLPPFCSGAVG